MTILPETKGNEPALDIQNPSMPPRVWGLGDVLNLFLKFHVPRLLISFLSSWGFRRHLSSCPSTMVPPGPRSSARLASVWRPGTGRMTWTPCSSFAGNWWEKQRGQIGRTNEYKKTHLIYIECVKLLFNCLLWLEVLDLSTPLAISSQNIPARPTRLQLTTV